MITIVVGGQYGSEGKGKVVEWLAHDYDVFVRVGGPNAGHVVYDGANRFTMRSVPCGWINRNSKLIIGAGAVVNPDILLKELDELEKYDPLIKKRVYVDPRATWIQERHIELETKIKDNIASTGQGVGSARVERISRLTHRPDILVGADTRLDSYFADTVQMLHSYSDGRVLVEGTQGSGLSVVHGDYPYCTSHDTNAAQMLADAGISPLLVNQIIMVIRAYPIRVGGNSGPMRNEVSFGLLESRIGHQIEHTSVTKKVRRIGMLDLEAIRKASMINKPTHFALMFADYINPSNTNVETQEGLCEDTKSMVKILSHVTGAKPLFVSTGPRTGVWLG